jgi:tRNA (guanine-N7-)-methyltransferase
VQPDQAPRRYRFVDRDPSDYPQPDLNPFMKIHRDFGPPALPACQAQQADGDWDSIFGREAPLHVEIGSGNGFWITHMAGLHPEWNWLGVEIRFKRVVLVAKKLRAAGIEHARIMRYDAFMVEEILPQGGIAGMYVNHPDPWPKDRQAKNRLLARPFGELVCRLLMPGARLRVKTDTGSYIDEFAEAIQGLPLKIIGESRDIARDGTPWPEGDDRVTNYQRKFYEKGLPVYALWVERAGTDA